MKTESHLWRGLWRVSALMRNRGEKSEVLRNDDMVAHITLAQARVIDQFFRAPAGGLMLKDLAAQLRLTPGAVSLLVDALVKQDILSRKVSESDRRAVSITLSKSGEEFRSKIEKFFDGLSLEILQGIPQEEVAVFLRVLDQLCLNLEKNK